MAVGEVVMPEPVGRVEARLIRSAGEALVRRQRDESLSKTDVVNRALIMYDFVQSARETGLEVGIYDPDDNEIRMLQFS